MAGKKESELEDSQFAFVWTKPDGTKVRKERIDDDSHVRNAVARFMQTQDADGKTPTDGTRNTAWSRIKKAAEEFDVEIAEDSWRDLKGADKAEKKTVKASARLSLQAASFSIGAPKGDNRHPFEGTLCLIDTPSTRAPEGSNGYRVVLPRDVAVKIGPSLIGQGIDIAANFKGHTSKKIGVIDRQWIEGNEQKVAGHLWDHDFPEDVSAIHAKADDLGMSFEIPEATFEPTPALGPDVATILDADRYTGAAILDRNAAAYGTTKIAASAADQKGQDMNPEDLKNLLAGSLSAALAPITAALNAQAAKLDAQGAELAGVRVKLSAVGKKSGKDALKEDLKDLQDLNEKAEGGHEDVEAKINDLGDKINGGKLDTEDLKAAHRDLKAAHETLGAHMEAAKSHLHAMKAAADTDGYRDSMYSSAVQASSATLLQPVDAKLTADLKAANDRIASLETRLAGMAQQPARTTTPAKGDLAASSSEGPMTAAKAVAALNACGITDPTTRMQAILHASIEESKAG
ncbi:MAG: hypothetical protein KGR26_06135 [Cyanobacteria bacterium REEB65]|nr:hypothetical protein [Cyanobacteria bacterium REEB65]